MRIDSIDARCALSPIRMGVKCQWYLYLAVTSHTSVIEALCVPLHSISRFRLPFSISIIIIYKTTCQCQPLYLQILNQGRINSHLAIKISNVFRTLNQGIATLLQVGNLASATRKAAHSKIMINNHLVKSMGTVNLSTGYGLPACY